MLYTCIDDLPTSDTRSLHNPNNIFSKTYAFCSQNQEKTRPIIRFDAYQVSNDSRLPR